MKHKTQEIVNLLFIGISFFVCLGGGMGVREGRWKCGRDVFEVVKLWAGVHGDCEGLW